MLDSLEAKFRFNIKEGMIELEGSQDFVDKHLDRFAEIFKSAIQQAVVLGVESNIIHKVDSLMPPSDGKQDALEVASSGLSKKTANNNRHNTKQSSPCLPPIPVDLKAGENKIGLREFYADKHPVNHYEKTVVFAYYLTKFNNHPDVRYGEILSCYEEVNEKKPSIVDIVKNSVRYKGWLEHCSDKFVTRLTISGENFVKFDLPQQKNKKMMIQESMVLGESRLV